MPIHVFCEDSKNREGCVERIYLAGEDIPETLPTGERRVLSAPQFFFVGDFSGGTSSRHRKHQFKGSIRPFEAGMDKDAARAKKAKREKQDQERKKFVGEQLRKYDL